MISQVMWILLLFLHSLVAQGEDKSVAKQYSKTCISSYADLFGATV